MPTPHLVVLAADGGARMVLPLPLSDDGTPPTEMRLFAAGDNPTTKGVFKFTAKSAELVMAEYLARGVEKPGDYNHASIPQLREDGTVRHPSDEEGKASCRYQLEVRQADAGPELWAVNIRWTPRAAELIRAREYYQTSNAFAHTKEGEVTQFVNFALVNDPATFNQPALVAASAGAPTTTPPPPAAQTTRTITMKMPEKMAAALKALMDGEYADEKEMTAKCKAALAEFVPEEKKEPPAEMTAQLTALSGQVATLTGEVTTLKAHVEKIAALTGKTAHAEQLAVLTAKFQSADKVETLSAEVARLSTESTESKIAAVLERGKVAGKLTPAMLEDAAKAAPETGPGKYIATLRASKDVTALSAYVDALPKLVATEEIKQPLGGKVALTPEEVAVTKLFGNDPKELEKLRAAKAQ